MSPENNNMKKNPFHYGGPVHEPENFFGRKKEIRDIYRQISVSNSVSLIGERKIGKTSLLLHLIHAQTRAKYGILPEDTLVYYIDMSSCIFSKSSDVFRRLLEGVSETASNKIEKETNTLLGKKYIHFQQFENIISKINNEDWKIVFFFDEFESISMIKYSDIFSRLRYLAQMYDVTFVISTLRDLMSLFREKGFSTSPFFNIFTKYQLRGLDENASRDLITTIFRRRGFEIDSTIVDSIIGFSSTNPFFLKVFCYFYFEKLVKGFYAFDDDLRNLIQQELEPHHQYNWEHLSRNEQAALLDIIGSGDTEDTFARRSLERKGYIRKEKTEFLVTSESFLNYVNEILDSRSSSFQDFRSQIVEVDTCHSLTINDKNALEETASKIEKQHSHLKEFDTPTFEIVGYFEREMRKFIKKNLEMGLNTNWFESSLDMKSREKIEERISKEKERTKGFEEPENPLYYALLETLRDIIIRRDNWDLCFSKYFEDKRVFSVKMEEIVDVRNRIAHFHPIHFNDAVIVIQNILWMLTRMRKTT